MQCPKCNHEINEPYRIKIERRGLIRDSYWNDITPNDCINEAHQPILNIEPGDGLLGEDHYVWRGGCVICLTKTFKEIGLLEETNKP